MLPSRPAFLAARDVREQDLRDAPGAPARRTAAEPYCAGGPGQTPARRGGHPWNQLVRDDLAGTRSRLTKRDAREGDRRRHGAVAAEAQPPPVHASQQLGRCPAQARPPFGGLHAAAFRLMLHFVTPFAVVRQQVTNPGRPQVDLAAQTFAAR